LRLLLHNNRPMQVLGEDTNPQLRGAVCKTDGVLSLSK
jgi:hypothetical protein